ncbi:hypothetical protein NUW58_g1413 [Xylaria curta]|uniref:Uncharacterized protein n=1 Tax=Xylaria curta TaxID=42375 RepID=A0ACC1PLQ2_9PEZI|nr:hypothetical protein NUW58_g1413 [Xylaria curta]
MYCRVVVERIQRALLCSLLLSSECYTYAHRRYLGTALGTVTCQIAWQRSTPSISLATDLQQEVKLHRATPGEQKPFTPLYFLSRLSFSLQPSVCVKSDPTWSSPQGATRCRFSTILTSPIVGIYEEKSPCPAFGLVVHRQDRAPPPSDPDSDPT